MEIIKKKVLYIPYKEILEYFGIPKITSYRGAKYRLMGRDYTTWESVLPNELYISKDKYLEVKKKDWVNLISERIGDVDEVFLGVEVRLLSKNIPLVCEVWHSN